MITQSLWINLDTSWLMFTWIGTASNVQMKCYNVVQLSLPVQNAFQTLVVSHKTLCNLLAVLSSPVTS